MVWLHKVSSSLGADIAFYTFTAKSDSIINFPENFLEKFEDFTKS